MSLRATLHDLADRFATDVLAAIRGASLQDLLAEQSAAPRRGRPRARVAAGQASGKRQYKPSSFGPAPSPSPSPSPRKMGGRLPRRGPAEIAKTLTVVVSALKATRGKGMRSEELQKALKLDKRELPRVLKTGLTKRVLKSRGAKRATVYMVA